MPIDLFEDENAGGPKDLFAQENITPKTDKFYEGLKDEALGVWDTAAGLLQGAVMGTLDPINALGKAAVGAVPDAEKEVNRLVKKNQFVPVSKAGERNLSAVGEAFNRYIIPVAPMVMPFAPRLSRVPKEPKPVVPDRAAIHEKAFAEPTPEPTQAAPELAVEGDFWRQHAQQDLLPFESSVETAADMQRARTNPNQLDIFGDNSGGQRVPYVAEENLRPPAPVDTMAQHPLFDQPEQGYGANPYGAHMGDWRVDENGMPIRADLSLEAQNLENPLQRGLWGDELGQRVDPIGQAATLADGMRQLDEQPVQGGIPLTQAIDNMDWAHRRGAIKNELTGAVEASGALERAKMEANSPFRGMGKDQSGVINEKLLTWLPEKIIDLGKKLGELHKGVTLHLQTSPYGPEITLKKNGEDIGFLYSKVVDHNGEKKLEVSRVAVYPQAKGQGYGRLMYQTLAGLGNDIVRSQQQLPQGKAMWDHWEATGFGKDGQINAGMGRGQRGGLWMGGNRPSATDLKSTQATPRPDTLAEPRSPENVAKKVDGARKVAALGIKDSQYDRVKTVEEAKARIDPKADMSKAGATNLRSGTEAALRTNVRNSVLNFSRGVLQEARNMAESLSKKYITDNKSGIIRMLKDLTQDEKNILAADLIELDRRQHVLSPEIMEKLGWTESQKQVGLRIREALDERYANVMKALGDQGLEGFADRKGYLPSMFDGSYLSFMGHKTKDGNFVITGVAQADTRWGHKAAVEKYKSMGAEYAEEVKIPRRGLKENVGFNRTYDGFVDVVNQLSKLDPKFADAKAAVDAHISDQVHALYRFDVHELKKHNVKGSLGDRPWLSQTENTKQLFEGLVNYLEEGFRYDALMGPLADIQKLMSDPEVKSQMPNTVEFLKKHVDKLSGQNLNAFGAAGNIIMDAVPRAVGVGTGVPRAITNAVVGMSTSLMMGFGNLGFALMQLSQLPISGSMEVLGARSRLGLSHTAMAHAVVSGAAYTSIMAASKMLGMEKWAEHVPNHLRYAYEWGHGKGMFDYSEAELVHNLNKSDTRVMVEKIVNSSISVPEKMTRPPMFMMMVDMFHKAGYYGEDGLLRAQAATDYAMTNYHPDERPGIYTALGQVGSGMGALSTYKHNFMEQQMSRTLSARAEPEAFVAGLALAFSLYGVAGMAGYEEMNTIVTKLTGKSIREYLLSNAKEPNVVMDGLASYKSGMDFQARISMSNLLPDPTNPLSAVPHMSNTFDIVNSAIDYAMKQDEASLRQMQYKTLPSSMRNIYEEKVMTDKAGMVRDAGGNKKIETPRTAEERDTRMKFGLRPLQERIDSETLWTQKQREFDRQKKMKDISNSFASQVRLGKPIGPMLEKYKELGGDPQELLKQVDTIIKEAQKTPQQRAQGEPGDSLSSVRRYGAYNP